MGTHCDYELRGHTCPRSDQSRRRYRRRGLEERHVCLDDYVKGAEGWRMPSCSDADRKPSCEGWRAREGGPR